MEKYDQDLEKTIFLWTPKFLEYWFGGKNAFFLFLFTGATWYYYDIHIVFIYVAPLKAMKMKLWKEVLTCTSKNPNLAEKSTFLAENPLKSWTPRSSWSSFFPGLVWPGTSGKEDQPGRLPDRRVVYCGERPWRERPGMQNVTFFTPSKFYAEKSFPKKCVIFGNTNFARKQRKQQNKIKQTQNN